MEYDRSPAQSILQALNLHQSRVIEDSGYTCYIATFAGSVEVGVYINPMNILYIRALDLLSGQVYKTDSERDNEETKIIRKFILAWCIRFEDQGSASAQALAMRAVYREIVNDPTIEISHVCSKAPGKFGRTSGRFIAVEFLPYLLFHLRAFPQAPKPHLEEIWRLLRTIVPLPGHAFSTMGLKTQQQNPRAAKNKIQSCGASPPNQVLETALAEAQTEIKLLRDTHLVEVRLAEEKYKIVADALKVEQRLVKSLRKEQNKLLTLRSAPPVRGRVAENNVLSLLKTHAPGNCQVSAVRHIQSHGDIMVTYRDSTSQIIGYAIIDVKDYDKTVTNDQMTKLEKDIETCRGIYGVYPAWASIVSLHSGISHDGGTGLNYLYNSVPILLVHDLMMVSVDDGGVHAIRQLLATGELLLRGQMSRVPDGSLDTVKIVETEKHPSARVPTVEVVGERKIYKTRTVPRFIPVPDPPSEGEEEEAEQSDSEEPEVAVVQVVASPDVLDTRIFRPVSLLTSIRYTQALKLDSLICYREGSSLSFLEVSTRLSVLLNATVKSCRRIINGVCAYHRESSRRLNNVAFREP